MERNSRATAILGAVTVLLGVGRVASGEGGSIVGWRDHVVVPQDELNDLVAVAAGYQHSLRLKADGSVVAWGDNSSAQCNVPAPNAHFLAVAAGEVHSLGVKTDGSIVAWGGVDPIPEPNTGFVAVASCR